MNRMNRELLEYEIHRDTLLGSITEVKLKTIMIKRLMLVKFIILW